MKNEIQILIEHSNLLFLYLVILLFSVKKLTFSQISFSYTKQNNLNKKYVGTDYTYLS